MQGGYGNKYDIDLSNAELLVFWSKNPKALYDHIDDIPLPFYLHYTLNDYQEFELNVPSLETRIELFQKISDKIGPERMIWRFDPIILYWNNEDLTHIIANRMKNIGEQLRGYTNKMVFSFVQTYKGNGFVPPFMKQQQEFLDKIISNNRNYWGNIEIASCAEKLEGVKHNKCMDPELIRKILGDREWLNTIKKDKGQRELCGCVESGDIGEYGLCNHKCIYCYAKK